MKLLAKELKSGKLARKLGDQVVVQKPTEWDEELAPRALGWSADRGMPSKLTVGLKAEVVELIIEHVAATVGRRLTPDFAALQLAQIGRGPWLRPMTPEAIDLTSGLYFLAELAMAGVAPRLRSATGALSHAPGRSGIVEILARRFDNKLYSPQDVYAEASRWQAETYDEQGADVEGVKAMFVGASQSFVRWFGLSPEVAATEWAEHTPSWTVKSAQTTD